MTVLSSLPGKSREVSAVKDSRYREVSLYVLLSVEVIIFHMPTYNVVVKFNREACLEPNRASMKGLFSKKS